MSKYTLYTIMAVLQMFLCTACYEDKGNYDYKDLPKVVYNDKYYPYVLIDEDGNEDTAPGYLTLRYGETIKIKPSYKLSKDADIELKFTWILRSDDTNQEDIVLGHEETLEWKADEAMKENCSSILKMPLTVLISYLISVLKLPILMPVWDYWY